MARLTEVVLRDGHQSLLATRMRTEDMLPACAPLDRVGFHSLEVWGGATFDSCIRFLAEDPWERLRSLRAALPNTPLQMLERGQNIVAYANFPDDVVEAFVRAAAKNGVDIFRVFDALNDLRNVRAALGAVKKESKHAQACICYTVSPVHTTELYVKKAKELQRMGADSLCIKDMAGLLGPKEAYDLVRALKEATKLPVAVHTHCTSGMAMMAHMEALRAGADILDTSMSALAWGTSHPPTESVVAALRGTEHDTRYDLALLAEINRYFESVWKKYAHLHSEETLRVDPSVILHQIPGGMYSNLVAQLKEQGALDKLPQVLGEVPKVRADLGYPPLVTPTSQIVGTQAVLNVLLGERYKAVPKEVKDYARGMYGEPPGSISDETRRKILGPDWESQVVRGRPADLLAPRMSALRQEAEDLGLVTKPEDVLTYALYPDVAKRFLKGEVKPEFTSDQLPRKKPEPAPAAPAAGPGRVFTVEMGAKSYTVRVVEPGRTGAALRAPAAPTAPRSGPGAAAAARAPASRGLPSAPEGAVRAPMQGTILRVKVKPGDKVKAGQVLAVLEAMKMENDIVAPRDGVVKEVLVQPGQTVQAGAGIAVVA